MKKLGLPAAHQDIGCCLLACLACIAAVKGGAQMARGD